MGSWNATCGVTQLPIRGGDRAVLIPLIVKQQDFLARDALSGSGSTANDLIAQPVCLPLVGAYNDYGSLDLDDTQPGVRYFVLQLKTWAEEGALMTTRSGKLVPLSADRVDIDSLDDLLSGDLTVMVPNARKAWLTQLHETYAGLDAEQKKGFSHYLAQMEVDPKTLPDTIAFALAGMFVPEALYVSLATAEGSAEAYGYWDEKLNEMVTFDGTRIEELTFLCGMSAAQRLKIVEVQDAFQKGVEDGELEAALVGRLLTALPLQCLPEPSRCNQQFFFETTSADQALVDAALNQDAQARQAWVSFTLFAGALRAMRKHWTPQAGAGNSSELYECLSLYKATHAFVTAQLHAVEVESPSED